MGLMWCAVFCFLAVAGALPPPDDVPLDDTELVLAFAVFRHGDRTPDQEELDLFPLNDLPNDVFFPYGTKALTNRGKKRGYRVGQYLRRRYDGLISRYYIPDEIKVRTTDFARTKMTALTAMAGLYPPEPAQKWHPSLDWQPVPYDTMPYAEDDLLYWYNCPRYLHLRDKVYESDGVKNLNEPIKFLYELLSEKTGMNITKTEDIFFLDNLFQALANVDIKAPAWTKDVMRTIKMVTEIEYAIEFDNDELIRLASGVLMSEIVNATKAAMAGDLEQPKLRIYSAHENNVAALMAAARVFQAHQPAYGATFSLELRKQINGDRYGMTAVYNSGAAGSEVILPVGGCGERLFCDIDTFLNLTANLLWSRNEFRKQCPRLQ